MLVLPFQLENDVKKETVQQTEWLRDEIREEFHRLQRTSEIAISAHSDQVCPLSH